MSLRTFITLGVMLLATVGVTRAVVADSSKQLADQKADNKKWESDAQQRQKSFMDTGQKALKDEHFDQAIENFQKAQNVYYMQWQIRQARLLITQQGEQGTTEMPGDRQVRMLLKNSVSDQAAQQVAQLADRQQGATVDATVKTAGDLEKEKKFGAAYALYDKISTMDMPNTLRKRYQKKCAESAGKILLAASRKLDDMTAAAAKGKDVEKVLAMLEEFDDQYDGMDDHPQLREKYATLTQRPEIADAKKQREAKRQLEAAKGLMEDGSLGEGYDLLSKVSETYADTPAGKEAARELEKIKADKTLMQQVSDKRAAKYCATKLNLARNLAANKAVERARDVCEDIIAKYPDSSYAREAAKLLAKLPRDAPTKP